jgi:hypothetical protein
MLLVVDMAGSVRLDVPLGTRASSSAFTTRSAFLVRVHELLFRGSIIRALVKQEGALAHHVSSFASE